MLISVHIPKCAGTSFRHILQALYGDRLWLNYGQVFVREQAHPGLVPTGTDCIHGHFFADAFDGLFPERQLITWVRHPVERVVSNYHHFLRSPDLRDDCCRALLENNLSLLEFAELDWMRNEATRYLAGKDLSDLAFVGIAERFLESLHLFGTLLGQAAPLPAPRVNVNPARRTPSYPISRAEFDDILALNASDHAWYLRACTQLNTAMPHRRPRAA